MASPVVVVVVAPGPVSPIIDGDTITTLMFLMLSAAVGWFLWRRK
jgi:LPXTG-motif cell wall-anchored protein